MKIHPVGNKLSHVDEDTMKLVNCFSQFCEHT